MKYRISISLVAGVPSVQDLRSKYYHTIQSEHIARSFTEETKTERGKNLILMGNIWERVFPYVSFS